MHAKTRFAAAMLAGKAKFRRVASAQRLVPWRDQGLQKSDLFACQYAHVRI